MNRDHFLLHVLSELDDLMKNMSPVQDLYSLTLDHQVILYSNSKWKHVQDPWLININLCYILDLRNSAVRRIRLQIYQAVGKIEWSEATYDHASKLHLLSICLRCWKLKTSKSWTNLWQAQERHLDILYCTMLMNIPYCTMLMNTCSLDASFCVTATTVLCFMCQWQDVWECRQSPQRARCREWEKLGSRGTLKRWSRESLARSAGEMQLQQNMEGDLPEGATDLGNQPERCLKEEVWVRQVRLVGWHRKWRGQEEKLNRQERQRRKKQRDLSWKSLAVGWGRRVSENQSGREQVAK